MLKVITRRIEDLKPATYNPRRLTENKEAHLRDSLERFGFVDPIIINSNPERKDIIIGGHQRLKVWGRMGNEEIPCVEVNLSEEGERELNVRLNANTGEWDYAVPKIVREIRE